jgi:hypothetical protein
MPCWLQTVFNYSTQHLNVENTETGLKWDISAGTHQDGANDRIPWYGKGRLIIRSSNGLTWSAIDDNWRILLTTPGMGQVVAAELHHINTSYNLDYYEGGPSFTILFAPDRDPSTSDYVF